MPGTNEYHRLRVAEVRRESVDAASILFDVPDGLARRFEFTPGQYVTLRARIDGEDVRRTYSLCSSPVDGELRVAVKHLPGGVFSGFVNEQLKPGDLLDVMPAAGHFTARFEPGRAAHYVAFAAGSGITPVLSLIKTALAIEPRSRFSLFYGNRTSVQILFLEELSALKNRFIGRLEVFHILSMEEQEFDLFNGRLDQAKCDRILETIVDPSSVTLFFACGPAGMMEAVEQSLRAHGVPAPKIMIERFGAANVPLDEETRQRVRAAAGRTVGVVLEGRKITVPFDTVQGNILDSVRVQGFPAPFACKGGVCATCRAKVLSGEIEMRVNYGLTEEEVAQGYVLTCQAVPLTDDVVVSYDS